MVATPMPGLEPSDISVDVDRGRIARLHGGFRGALKDAKDVVCDEWTPGPYERTVSLPADVDAERANVTCNNGVLVVVLPVATETTPAHLELQSVTPTEGERVGHRGHPSP